MATKVQYQKAYRKEKEATKNMQSVISDKQLYIEELEHTIATLGKKNVQEDKSLAQELKEARRLLDDKDAEIEEIKKKLILKTEECERLKSRLNKTSQNSSKPPSTDGLKKKIYNSRIKTGKSEGGQVGHKGSTASYVETPDTIIEKKVKKCACGGHVICSEKYKKKQIIDIEIKRIVTEERAYSGTCSTCGKKNDGVFSTQSPARIQYGPELKSFIALLSVEGFVPLAKIVELVQQVTKKALTPSKGTVSNIIKELACLSKETVAALKEHVRKSSVLYADETSVRLNGKGLWAHVISTPTIDILEAFTTRGFDAILEMGILPGYTGVLMCDHFTMYNKLTEAIHARCNAHILREAKALYEIHKRSEIGELLTFLTEMNQWVKQKKQTETEVSPDELKTILSTYEGILTHWKIVHDIDYTSNERPRKGDNPFHPEKLLVDRLLKFQEEHMRFVTNFNVDFDNNMAERAIRMTKTKMKVSGCFRSESGLSQFFILRSVVQTAKKNSENYYELFKQAFSKHKIIEPTI